MSCRAKIRPAAVDITDESGAANACLASPSSRRRDYAPSTPERKLRSTTGMQRVGAGGVVDRDGEVTSSAGTLKGIHRLLERLCRDGGVIDKGGSNKDVRRCSGSIENGAPSARSPRSPTSSPLRHQRSLGQEWNPFALPEPMKPQGSLLPDRVAALLGTDEDYAIPRSGKLRTESSSLNFPSDGNDSAKFGNLFVSSQSLPLKLEESPEKRTHKLNFVVGNLSRALSSASREITGGPGFPSKVPIVVDSRQESESRVGGDGCTGCLSINGVTEIPNVNVDVKGVVGGTVVAANVAAEKTHHEAAGGAFELLATWLLEARDGLSGVPEPQQREALRKVSQILLDDRDLRMSTSSISAKTTIEMKRDAVLHRNHDVALALGAHLDLAAAVDEAKSNQRKQAVVPGQFVQIPQPKACQVWQEALGEFQATMSDLVGPLSARSNEAAGRPPAGSATTEALDKAAQIQFTPLKLIWPGLRSDPVEPISTHPQQVESHFPPSTKIGDEVRLASPPEKNRIEAQSNDNCVSTRLCGVARSSESGGNICGERGGGSGNVSIYRELVRNPMATPAVVHGRGGIVSFAKPLVRAASPAPAVSKTYSTGLSSPTSVYTQTLQPSPRLQALQPPSPQHHSAGHHSVTVITSPRPRIRSGGHCGDMSVSAAAAAIASSTATTTMQAVVPASPERRPRIVKTYSVVAAGGGCVTGAPTTAPACDSRMWASSPTITRSMALPVHAPTQGSGTTFSTTASTRITVGAPVVMPLVPPQPNVKQLSPRRQSFPTDSVTPLVTPVMGTQGAARSQPVLAPACTVTTLASMTVPLPPPLLSSMPPPTGTREGSFSVQHPRTERALSSARSEGGFAPRGMSTSFRPLPPSKGQQTPSASSPLRRARCVASAPAPSGPPAWFRGRPPSQPLLLQQQVSDRKARSASPQEAGLVVSTVVRTPRK